MPDSPNSFLTPTYIGKMDQRFATTFLSSKYRNYSVKGEVIMDKTTGELFIKRAEDGRIISFDQNKKYLHDLLLEFRVILSNNTEFYYPTNKSSLYLSTDYDLVTMNNNFQFNILDGRTNNVVINNNADDNHAFKFILSKDTNGFLCKPMTRDSDKSIVEFLSNMYNDIFQNYEFNHPSSIKEKEKLLSKDWKYNNTVISYTIKLLDKDNNIIGNPIKKEQNIHINEEIFVNIDKNDIDSTYKNQYDKILIEIDSLDFYKIRVLNNKIKDGFEPVYVEEIPNLIEANVTSEDFDPSTTQYYIKHGSSYTAVSSDASYDSFETYYVLDSTKTYYKSKSISDILPSNEVIDFNSVYYTRHNQYYEGSFTLVNNDAVCGNKLYYNKIGNPNYEIITIENESDFDPAKNTYFINVDSNPTIVESTATYDSSLIYYIDTTKYEYVLCDNITKFEEGINYYEDTKTYKEVTELNPNKLLVVGDDSINIDENSIKVSDTGIEGITIGSYVERIYTLTSDVVCPNILYYTKESFRYIYNKQTDLTEFLDGVEYFIKDENDNYILNTEEFNSNVEYYTRTIIWNYALCDNITEFDPEILNDNTYTTNYWVGTFVNTTDDIPNNSKNYYTFNGRVYSLFTNITVFDTIINSNKYETLINGYNKFIAVDKEIQIPLVNIIYFIDKADDVLVLNNENIISVINVEFLNKYLLNISSAISNSSSIVLSDYQPSDVLWNYNTLWAQSLYDKGYLTIEDIINDENIKTTDTTRIRDIILHQKSNDVDMNILFPYTKYSNVLSSPTVINPDNYEFETLPTDNDIGDSPFHLYLTGGEEVTIEEINTLFGY